MTGSLIERVRERLASESGPLRPSVVAAAIRAESGGMLGDTEVLANLRVLQTELTGAGILEPLLSADGTTDVLVTAPDSVWVDDGNGLRRSQIRFADESAVRRLAQRLALAAGRRLDDAQPWVDGQLTGIGVGGFAVRLHAVLPPVATQGTCLSLRVLRPATQDLAALAAAGAIDPAAAALVADIVTARLAFLVCGGTGAGKTTLLAAMLGAVSPDERIVCVEDAAELAPRHPHLVKLVARRANVEGIGEVTVRQLVRQALRMRPDRIVVGEVRGAEVVDLLADPLHGRHRGFHCVGAQPHHRSRAQHQGLASCAGASTVEAALAIATLVLVLVLCLAGVTAVSMQVRCIDAAREAARLAARGDVRSATDVARSIAPRAALVQVHRDGEFVVATVTAHSNLLPTLDIAARAISVAEPG